MITEIHFQREIDRTSNLRNGKQAQEKVNEVVKGLLNQKDMRMAREIEGEMIDLLDSMYSIPDFAETKKIREDILRTVRENIELLRNSGLEDIAKEIEKEMEDV